MLRKSLTLSERCHALAQECRAKTRSFKNVKPRAQMFQLAHDYERKAKLSEALDASLRMQHEPDAPLIPEISEVFVQQPKE
jgi:hypothetical protein